MAEIDTHVGLKRDLTEDGDGDGETRSSPNTPPKASSSRDSVKQNQDEDETAKDREEAQYTSTTLGTRRNANGSVSSVFSGNKIRHLKKDDGVPLWRKDIQFDFLKLIFDDEQKVFTCFSDGTTGHTFSEIYIDAMAKSSKTSKILKEKLSQDRDSAVSMAMVCLLVNVGRMNTTLNFFPEMRAQLRTYHSVPALQARQDPGAYKQLQDAPRLKSILKGASEDVPQPNTMEEIRKAKVPRTNPVNLIFVLAQYAPKISEIHFTPPIDFFDLVMRSTLSSKSRARAFLWLLWWYLESDFSDTSCRQNPFGPGKVEDDAEGTHYKVPALENLTEAQAAMENVDTDVELAFGENKRLERLTILSSDPSPAMTALKRARKDHSNVHNSHDDPDDPGSPLSEPARTPSPPARRGGKGGRGRGDAPGPVDGRLKLNRGTLRLSSRRSTPLADPTSTASDSAIRTKPDSRRPGRSKLGASTAGEPLDSRNRPLTAFQAGLNDYRRGRVQEVLNRQIRQKQFDARRKRAREGGLLNAWKRIKLMSADYDSEEEEAAMTAEPDQDGDVAVGDLKPVSASLKRSPDPRLVGSVWMAGFMTPPTEDSQSADPVAPAQGVSYAGDSDRHYGIAFSRAQNLFRRMDELAMCPLKPVAVLGARKTEFDESDFDATYDIGSSVAEGKAALEALAAQGGRKGARKSAVTGTGKRGKGGKSKGGPSGGRGGRGGKKRGGGSRLSAAVITAEDEDDLDPLAMGTPDAGSTRKTTDASIAGADELDEDDDGVRTPGGRDLDSEDRELLGQVDASDEDGAAGDDDGLRYDDDPEGSAMVGYDDEGMDIA